MTARAHPLSTRPGIASGFGAVLRGVGFLLRSPRSWPWAMVPAAILATLSVAMVWASIVWVKPMVAGWFTQSDAWYASTVAWFGAAFAAALGLLLSLAATPPLSGPALERIVALVEVELGVPPRAPMSVLAEIWCGLRAQAFAALFAVPILAVLWVVELAAPPAAVVTTPLKMLVACFSVAWNLFDYPLTLRGVRMRARLRLLAANKRAALGFGAAFALLFWIPCFGVLLLPAGVAAATRLVWRILATTPDLLPELARPVAPAQAEAELPASAQIDRDPHPPA